MVNLSFDREEEIKAESLDKKVEVKAESDLDKDGI